MNFKYQDIINTKAYIMKFTYYFISMVILLCSLSSCGGDKWWGDRLISKIEYDNGGIETFVYSDNGKLERYYYGKTTEYDTITYYDVTIQNLDSVVLIKGIMPCETAEESGYAYGESTYKIGKTGLASSCVTIYSNDSIENFHEDYSSFSYKRNQLSEISNGRNYYEMNYEDNDITYKVPSSSSGFVMMTSFINYTKDINKSGLPLILESYLLHHRAAFFSGILGRATKHLPDRHAVSRGGDQLIYDYSYDEDAEKYTTSVIENRGSNVRMGFMGDLFSNRMSYEITYLEKKNP